METSLCSPFRTAVPFSQASVEAKLDSSVTGSFAGEEAALTPAFTPVSYCVPIWGWDLTPSELRPLSWYLTETHVANIVYAVYDEEEVGRWKMFADVVDEAYVYFHPPYGYAARELGYRNREEVLSAWLPPTESDDDGKSLSVGRRYD